MSALTLNSTRDNIREYLKHIKYEHLVAGTSSGLAATLILHPLDLLKIRFAVDDGKTVTTPKYTSIAGGLRSIYNQEGVRGLYRGVTPNLMGSGASWGLYFFFYNIFKSRVQNGDGRVQIATGVHILCASQAGVMTLLLTNPIWVIKTRLCLQTSTPNLFKLPEYKVYKNMRDAVRKIYVTEGFQGFYKGLVPGLFGVSHGAIQFVTYEELKSQYNISQGRSINAKLSVAEYLAFAAVSKAIAVSVTYPYQVLRGRIQSQHQKYNGVVDCLLRTYKFEGIWGFYKGLGTNLLRVTPATMITFVTYEHVSRYLINFSDKQEPATI